MDPHSLDAQGEVIPELVENCLHPQNVVLSMVRPHFSPVFRTETDRFGSGRVQHGAARLFELGMKKDWFIGRIGAKCQYRLGFVKNGCNRPGAALRPRDPFSPGRERCSRWPAVFR